MRSALCLIVLLLASVPTPAQESVAGVVIQRGAKIDLVFYTADDCGYCNRWKNDSKADAVEWAERNNVSFFEVGKPKIAMLYSSQHYPTAAMFAWEETRATGRLRFVIPRWVVYADRKRVVEGSGTADWSRVLRLAKDVVAARNGR